MYTLIGIINLLLLAEPRRNTRKPPTVLTGLSGSWFPGGDVSFKSMFFINIITESSFLYNGMFIQKWRRNTRGYDVF